MNSHHHTFSDNRLIIHHIVKHEPREIEQLGPRLVTAMGNVREAIEILREHLSIREKQLTNFANLIEKVETIVDACKLFDKEFGSAINSLIGFVDSVDNDGNCREAIFEAKDLLQRAKTEAHNITTRLTAEKNITAFKSRWL